ncbi:BIR7B protein, partial [Eurystomus gularis]|nr:BIR7B protein [Eurystomus gularis]
PAEKNELRSPFFQLFRSSMKNEARRLRTFWQWPHTSPVSPQDLVKAGFFFLGPRDEVQCFCCGGVLKDWHPGDCPAAEHQRFFPSCKFICGEDVGNQEMLPLQQAFDTVDGQFLSLLPGMDSEETALPSEPRHPEMETEEMRLSTFQNWPQYTDMCPEQLARAGFFYTGQIDIVRCFHCDGGVRSWSFGDDPWREHAKWYPGCEFLLQSRGRAFVNRVQDLGFFFFFGKDTTQMSTEQQLQRLQEERICKVCMEKDVSVVFVPCGHLIACRECALGLKDCPICREFIERRVRTFMS